MSAPSKKPGYETKDIHFYAIVFLTVVLFGILLGTMLVTRGMDRLLQRFLAKEDTPVSPMAELHRLPPEPRLQVNPSIDMIRLSDVENVQLNSYGWIVNEEGKAHIPIHRAIAILAERGLPSRKKTP